MSKRVRMQRRVAGILALLLILGTGAGMAMAAANPTGLPQWSQYDDDIANANKKKAERDRQLQDLEHALAHTDKAIVAANRELQELEGRLPIVEAEYRQAQERLDAALLEQQIVADRLAAAEAEDERLGQQIKADEKLFTELSDTLAAIARDVYKNSQNSASLSIVFGATTSSDFVDGIVAQETSARVQSNAITEMENVVAVNKNRAARQEAVRDYIAELKVQADELVAVLEIAHKEAEDKKQEVERLLAEAQTLKNFLESQRAAYVAQQEEMERQQRELLAEIEELVRKKLAESGTNPGKLGKGYLSFPLRNVWITSHYGWRIHPIYGDRRLHAGTDFGANCGVPVLAAAGGTVVKAQFRPGLGEQVLLDHGVVGDTVLMSSYNHLSGYNVRAGNSVNRGDVIGYIGTTGNSTGCHLHFEVYLNGATTNPMDLLPHG